MKRLPLFEAAVGIFAPVPALLLAAALLFPGTAAADPAKAQLTLTVTGIKDHKGALMIAIYDQAGYDADKQVAASMLPVSADTATTTFELPAGQYGIKLFHDVDGDGKMGANPFGMPIEPFAFSNNAPAQFGPAKWDAAKFDVAATGAVHTIKLP
ncbi:MAG: DUF2141 domain-containing protein [Hyphomonadaceae bacterium]|nr:DUF2141 domain-containing protein [Hyphomonadaceae bacterium]